MRKTLAERQNQMRERTSLGDARRPEPALPMREWNHVDYSRPVKYINDEVQLLNYWPKACGVYLLNERGQYYIGQSVDVPARYASHRLQPSSCKFEDPRCVLLAVLPWLGWEHRGVHLLLNSEARFLSAALQLGIPLTNTNLTAYKKEKLVGMFADVSEERGRLEKAIKILR